MSEKKFLIYIRGFHFLTQDMDQAHKYTEQEVLEIGGIIMRDFIRAKETRKGFSFITTLDVPEEEPAEADPESEPKPETEA